ncbi:MAG: cyclic peptide export ABC transporter [Gammaproteobacteria bacterium]
MNGAPSTAFIRMLLSEAGPAKGRLVALTALAGLGTAMIVIIVNSVADRRNVAVVDYPLLGTFILSCVVVLSAQARALKLTTRASEATVERLRVRVVELIRRADLDAFEALGPARVYAQIAGDTATISEAGPPLVYGATSALALILAALYIATLSTLAFVVIVGLFVATTYLFLVSQRRSVEQLADARGAEARFFATFDHLLRGFKEVKMSTARGDELERQYLAALSRETEWRKIEAVDRLNAGLNIAHASFYLLLASVVFALPQYLAGTETVMKMTYTVIFMLATIDGVMRALPLLTKANVALADLARLETQLAAAGRSAEAPALLPAPTMRRIEMRGAVYSYVDLDGRPLFTVGPCDLTLEAGETVFIVGGNGSGKSTLLRMLTWLYEPKAGVILWDGQIVDRSNVADYRNLFATVFADFHLFDRLYGFPDVDALEAEALLQTMGIAGKTRFREGGFTNLDLSTGQRKRLAFAAALLEARPVYVLDELAADQDSEFRRRFYEELLPGLKARGKTLVVVTHDERYFHVADRVLVMEDGRFVEGGRPR